MDVKIKVAKSGFVIASFERTVQSGSEDGMYFIVEGSCVRRAQHVPGTGAFRYDKNLGNSFKSLTASTSRE